MAAKTTLFMTPEESVRIQKTVQDRMQKCQERAGQSRERSDPSTLIQQATSVSLMQDLSFAAFGLGTLKKSQDTMVAYAVGRPYLPCTANLEDLQPMKLADLRMETHHLGRVLSLRRVSPVAELEASSWAVVQGELPDEAERIEIFLHKSKHGKDILNMSSEFLVKEPYYTLNNQGECTIRVDHPSDLVISTLSDGPEEWRRKTFGDVTHVVKSPGEYKEQGNAALQKQDLARAHAHYTEGLQSISEDAETRKTLALNLYRNRSYVNLLLKRFDEAKADALSSLTHSEDEEQKSLDAKAYYRAGLAAYALGDFMDAKSHFEAQEKLQPDNAYAKFNLRRIEMRLQEEATGLYNLKKAVGSLSKNQGRPDVASFNGHTEVRSSPGAGRGLFATRDIPPGDIVMCEKAFCVVWGYEPEACCTLTCDVRDDATIRVFPAGLQKAVVQKLLNNPSQAEKVLDLFGDCTGLGNKLLERDGGPIIDTFQIHDIIQRNAFGLGQQTEDEDISNASTGLWIRASYINHSCVPNTKKDYIGDLMILRATHYITGGEEITHAYDESSDYEARTAALHKNWGFKCWCALCAVEEADDPAVRRLRRELEATGKVNSQHSNYLLFLKRVYRKTSHRRLAWSARSRTRLPDVL
ncbi:TPR domain-containing protein [Ilyonectria robusta]